MGGLSNVVGFYSLYGPDDLWKLKETAEKVEQELLASKEISQIGIVGYPPVIIAVDMDEIGREDLAMLHYAGLSRACGLLRVLLPKSAKATYQTQASAFAIRQAQASGL